MNILICHPQSDFRARLSSYLQDAFQRQRLHIDETTDEASAMAKVGNRKEHEYDFLIASLDLAPNPALPVDQAHRGLAIVKKVNESGAKTQCLVLIPGDVRPEVAALFASLSCLLVTERMEMLEDIILAIRSTLSKSKVRQRLFLKLVQDPNSSNWNFWLDGGSFGFPERRGAFPIQPDLLEDLVARSKAIPTAEPDWLTELGRIGKNLYAQFFDQENNFSKLFRSAVKNAGGIDSVRFSFDIRRDCYSLAIEALVPYDVPGEGTVRNSKKSTPASKLPFWMLKAPIYRSFSPHNQSCTLGEQPRPYLFNRGNEPINCLIIQADAAGEARIPGIRKRKGFNPLLNVSEGCEKLEAKLLANKKRWQIGEVERIAPGRSPKTFKQRLFKLLATRKWHLVHFCGHSYYRPGVGSKQGKGYLLLPGKPIEALDASEFAHRLANTQFLFLSSCKSSEEAFAFEMARNFVPAVLGFRWSVDDRSVPHFMDSFYDHLFLSRSIESAFVVARKQVRRHLGVQNQLWAAPMLVLMHPDEGKQKPAAAAAVAGSAA
jgi:CHAT domain